MIFQQEITIEPGYTEDNQFREDFLLPAGRITQVKIGFTPESAAALHVATYHLEYKLYPTTPGVWFSWAGEVFSFEEEYPLVDSINRFSLRGWNDSSTQPHTATFWFTVLADDKKLERVLDQIQGFTVIEGFEL